MVFDHVGTTSRGDHVMRSRGSQPRVYIWDHRHGVGAAADAFEAEVRTCEALQAAKDDLHRPSCDLARVDLMTLERGTSADFVASSRHDHRRVYVHAVANLELVDEAFLTLLRAGDPSITRVVLVTPDRCVEMSLEGGTPARDVVTGSGTALCGLLIDWLRDELASKFPVSRLLDLRQATP